MASKEEIIEKLKQVIDPEIGIDIYTLELIYDVKLEGEVAKIRMTLTSPMCPYGPQLLQEVKDKTGSLEGVKEVDIDLTFDPPWEPSQELRATLGV